MARGHCHQLVPLNLWEVEGGWWVSLVGLGQGLVPGAGWVLGREGGSRGPAPCAEVLGAIWRLVGRALNARGRGVVGVVGVGGLP